MATREGHGWWPYWIPYFGFLLLAQFAPAGAALVAFPVKVALPLGFLVFFFARGAYPELRGYGFRPSRVAGDVGVGVLGAALWMVPYVLVDDWRPDPEGAFDPALYGESLVWLTLSIRMLGYGFVTPFMEELFVRSWLQRYVQVLEKPAERRDFRNVPIGVFSWVSLGVVTMWFMISHVPWEWPVAVVWVLLSQAWLYHRKHLMSVVILHAASNVSILVFVLLANGVFVDGEGNPIDLWFFV